MRRAGGYIRGTAIDRRRSTPWPPSSFLTLLGVPLAGPAGGRRPGRPASSRTSAASSRAPSIVLLRATPPAACRPRSSCSALIVVMNIAEHRFLGPSVYRADPRPASRGRPDRPARSASRWAASSGCSSPSRRSRCITEVSGAIIDALGERDADEAALQAARHPGLARPARAVELAAARRRRLRPALRASSPARSRRSSARSSSRSRSPRRSCRRSGSSRRGAAGRGPGRRSSSASCCGSTVAIVTILSVAALVGPAVDSVQGSIAAAQTGATTADGSLPTGVSGTVSSLSERRRERDPVRARLARLRHRLLRPVPDPVRPAWPTSSCATASKAWAWMTGQIGGWREREIRAAGDHGGRRCSAAT